MAENNDMTIDSLQIEIASSSTKAEQSIDRLCASLMGLNTPLKKIGSNVGNIRNVVKALSGLDGLKMPDLSKTIEQLDKLSRINLKNLQDKKLNISLEISGFDKAERLKYAVQKTASDIHTITDSIAKDLADAYNIKGADASKLTNMIAQMGKNIAIDKNHMGDLSDTEEIFKFIIEHGKVARESFDESITGMKEVYTDFLAYVNQNKIKLTDAVDTRNFNENTSRTERQLFFNQKSGRNIDTIWEDMVNNFPGIMMNIRDIINEEDQVYALLEKIRFAKDELANKSISLFDPNEVSKIKTNVFNSVNESYIEAIDGVNSTIASNMQKSAKTIPLDLKIDPNRFAVQIEKAINEAAKKDYGKINVKLGVDTTILKQEINNSLGEIDASKLSSVSEVLRNISKEFSVISQTNIKQSGFTGFANGLKRLIDASGSFDTKTFNEMSNSTKTFANNIAGIDAKSSGVASLANSIARLINASKAFNSSSFDDVSRAIHKLCEELKDVGKGTEETASFSRSISGLISIINKFDADSNNFTSVTKELAEMFNTIAKIPVSENIARTAEGLGELANVCGNATTSTTELWNSFTSSHSAIQVFIEIFNEAKDSVRIFITLVKKISSALKTLVSGIVDKVSSGFSALLSMIKKVGSGLKVLGTEVANVNKKFAIFVGSGINKAISGLKNFWKELTGAKDNISSVNSLHLSFKNLLTTIIGFRGITGVFNWAKEALTLGGDITEIDHIVESVFGENMTGYIEEWSRNAINQFGIAQGAAKQYAGTLNAMFKASNITSDKSSAMAIKMVELAGDLSAFYNIDTADAYQKIQAGLAGMVRPLRSLGIDLSVASLKEYALAQGITKSYTEMTQAEKVMLRYQYLLDATKMQSGDFARTSGKLKTAA